MLLPPLPIPSEDWLVRFNDEYRKHDVAVGERPFRALANWAEANGQNEPLDQLILAHLGTEAFNAIYAFFKANTSLGRDHSAPIRQSCFLYDGAFWPLYVPMIYGRCVVDPIRCVAGMPSTVFRSLGFDSDARDKLDAHWFDCSHHMNNHGLIDGEDLPELARSFLAGGEKSLFAAVESLLGIPPNPKAAELSRDAFESVLKGFAVVKTGLTRAKAIEIGHRLALLLQRCAALPAAEYKRVEQASFIYPKVEARYEKTAFPMHQLWQCYAEAQHVMAISLRSLAGELGA
jgi:hypothetical protein